MSGLARLRRPLPPVLWDMNDLETLKHVRELRITPWSKGKPLRYLQTIGFLAEERRAARAADLGFVCSEIDGRRAANFLGGEFRTAPNAVEVPATPMPLDGGPPSVLFVGFFGYDPNRDAADWFIDDIWPRILEQMPEAQLRIAGSRHERLRAYGKELRNVELLGFVPDLDRGVRALACLRLPDPQRVRHSRKATRSGRVCTSHRIDAPRGGGHRLRAR